MRRVLPSLVPLVAILAACSGRTSNGSGSADAAVSALLMESGVQCAPALPRPAVQACTGSPAGADCTVTRDDHTATGTCQEDDGRLMCAPSDGEDDHESDGENDGDDDDEASSPAVAACSGKAATDACSFAIDGLTLTGACVSLPHGLLACVPAPSSIPALTEPCTGKAAGAACTVVFGMMDHGFTGVCTGGADGILACLPPPPAPVQACAGLALGASCSVTTGEHAYTGTCAALPTAGIVACLPPPPPPPPIVTACSEKHAGDACTFTDDERTFDGICREAGMRATLACLPPPPATPPRVAACTGKTDGAGCTVMDDGKTHAGTCRQLRGSGPLICMSAPPPPPQAAVQACATAKADDACSFTWEEHTVNGACRAMPDGTLVCSPACRR